MKNKDRVEKEQYLCQRRNGPTQHKKPKKAVAGGQSGGPLSTDGSKFSGRAAYSGAGDHQHQMLTHVQSRQSSDNKTSDGLSKLVDDVAKKAKLHKCLAENANPVEKKKKKTKEISTKTISEHAVAVNNTVEKNTPPGDNEKYGGVVPTSSSAVEVNKQAVHLSTVNLPNVLINLRTLALDPFHATERSSLALVRQVFLKYRSIVFKKSLPSSESTTGGDANEAGRKRRPLDRLEEIKKKMTIGVSDDIQKEKVLEDAEKMNISEATEKKKNKEKERINDSEGKKKKKITDCSSSKTVAAAEKKQPPPQRQSQTESHPGIDSSDFSAKYTPFPPPRKEIFSAKSYGSTSKKIAAVKKKQPPPQRQTESQPGMNSRDVSAKSTPPPKSLQLDPSIRTIYHPPAKRSVHPTMLVMKFPTGATLPSVSELKARFARFGRMDPSAARVYWNTHTCRLVYHQRVHAEAALQFASESNDLFGSTNVRCYLRDVESEAAAPESKEDSAIKASNSAVESSIASQQQKQFKSFLKKPMGEKENNGVGRGKRIKLVLGGEEGNKNEQPLVVGGSMTQNPSIRNRINTPHVPTAVEERVPIESQQLPDISQKMMSLLKQNYDIIKNLERRLG